VVGAAVVAVAMAITAVSIAVPGVLVLTVPVVPLRGRSSNAQSGSKDKCGSHFDGLSLTTSLFQKNWERDVRSEW